jgi:hypothetical protein
MDGQCTLHCPSVECSGLRTRPMRFTGFFGTCGAATLLLLFSSVSLVAQTVTDSVGDIPSGDPTYLDLNKVRVRQVGDKIQIDFYPSAPIPLGNQVGITTTTVFEVYLDVDSNALTGTPIGDIGFDYMLRADLYQWNGKSWIDGNVYWGYDRYGNWSHSDGFFISKDWLLGARFRWEFSLVSLKWPRVDWVVRLYYRDHYAERVPDSGHATLFVDTSLVPNLDSAATEFIKIIYPQPYQTVLDSFDVLHTVDVGAQLESDLCGTEFTSKPLVVTFSPWLNGVAYSGNPVKMGSWSWGNQPAWFIIFHELGHNFTLAASRFQKLYPGGGYVSAGGDDWHYGTDFVEAWATMVGLDAIHELMTNPGQYGIVPAARQDLELQYANTRSAYLSALKQYELLPDHSHLYPDVVDGIFLTIADSLGYDVIPRWFKMLKPPDAPWSRLNGINPSVDYDGSKITSMTITACGFSVAARADLEDLFRTRWDFPIDGVLYAQIKPEIEQMINSSSWAESPRTQPPLEFRSFGNYPNPFNPRTTISFQIPKPTSVGMRLYNVIGQLLRDSPLGTFQPGTHNIDFDGGDLPSGVYYYVLSTSQGSLTNKLVIVR